MNISHASPLVYVALVSGGNTRRHGQSPNLHGFSKALQVNYASVCGQAFKGKWVRITTETRGVERSKVVSSIAILPRLATVLDVGPNRIDTPLG